MPDLPFYRRYVDNRLIEAVKDSPAVLIFGPRQCGKTTLAPVVCEPRQLPWRGAGAPWAGSPVAGGEEHTYFSFDDDVVRGGARLIRWASWRPCSSASSSTKSSVSQDYSTS